MLSAPGSPVTGIPERSSPNRDGSTQIPIPILRPSISDLVRPGVRASLPSFTLVLRLLSRGRAPVLSGVQSWWCSFERIFHVTLTHAHHKLDLMVLYNVVHSDWTDQHFSTCTSCRLQYMIMDCHLGTLLNTAAHSVCHRGLDHPRPGLNMLEMLLLATGV